ncbi:MAG TPA: PAS-domain containing protein, partial [Paenalcaligenes sp.]|nr:PAS-domain containing protein [Paenalcaligenes sp.]
DQAGPELRFNREILLATLDNLDQGVSVVDADMRLVAWNQRYQQMFNYPPGMLYVGRHVADLIRFNAQRGKIPYAGPDDIEEAVQKRINYMRAGTSHVFQRTLNQNTQVIELRGRPLPGGGYVTSYNDITEFQRVESELLEINETLEQRVAARTKEARQAQESRTLFLTAVSHDVLQPINAARLFAAALYGAAEINEMRRLSERVDTSLRAAEELLDGLLDISQLDTGALQPDKKVFEVAPFLKKIKDQYVPIARRRNLQLKIYSRDVLVYSDKRLLRRVLQNFISNALRYTAQGRIVIGVRVRAGKKAEFQVWDTGQGIPKHHLEQIFDEFRRYEQRQMWGERGLGLGLSICQRISTLLDHRLSASSEVGKGSMFSIRVPLATEKMSLPADVGPTVAQRDLNSQLEGLKVLCLDNDVEILSGVKTLLSQWGVEVITATTVDEALGKMNQQPHVLLVDYHLHDRLNGLDGLDLLRRDAKHIHGALFTADGSDEVKRDARERGYLVLTKPVRPASLRSFLAAQYKH